MTVKRNENKQQNQSRIWNVNTLIMNIAYCVSKTTENNSVNGKPDNVMAATTINSDPKITLSFFLMIFWGYFRATYFILGDYVCMSRNMYVYPIKSKTNQTTLL